ncbi:hypothetical protein LCGC14_1730620 [marine sediment metagenome]|uniref:Uncharacterized protein n=1 Tax=marine sediment metagenome TaxID=412755 RepID=A0A0F9K9F0_9ZZZZ
MPPIVETVDAPQVAPATFPKWYTEAPVDNPYHGVLIDEVRTGLLDYPHPHHIEKLEPGCVTIRLGSQNYLESVVSHLYKKGFQLSSNKTPEEFLVYKESVKNLDSLSSGFVVFGHR